MSDQEEAKKKLLNLVAGIPEKADEQEKIGKAIQESAQQAREIAVNFHEILSNTPAASIPPAELSLGISFASSWHETADKLKATRAVNIFAATTSAFTTSSSGFLVSYGPIEDPQMRAARARLRQTLARAPLVERAKVEMQRLGLDKRTGNIRTPLELLEDAQKAYGGGPGAILIPLREAIEGALAALLRRRPTQEPAGKPVEKIESIGRQSGREGLPVRYFADLGATAKRLLPTLSGAKQIDLPQERVSELFYQGVSFLNALLESLDEAKLRP